MKSSINQFKKDQGHTMLHNKWSGVVGLSAISNQTFIEENPTLVQGMQCVANHSKAYFIHHLGQ